MAREPKLSFAPIDMKDKRIAVDTYYDNNKHNVAVCHQAHREYLEKLKALQEEITAKFEPQLVEGNEFGYQSDGYYDAHDEHEMSQEEYDKYSDMWYT